MKTKTIVNNNDFYKGSLHRKGTYECDGVKIVISPPPAPFFFLVTMSKINIDVKSKSIRKYAGHTIALEKQNYKTSKIAFILKMGVIFFLNCYSWFFFFCMLIEIKRNLHIKIREKNRLLTYMHGPNFNEILETKENMLRLTYRDNEH